MTRGQGLGEAWLVAAGQLPIQLCCQTLDGRLVGVVHHAVVAPLVCVSGRVDVHVVIYFVLTVELSEAFSSDNALRGRCHTQLEMRRPEQRGTALRSLHSLYLAWLLQARDPKRWEEAASAGGREARSARRGEADALAESLVTDEAGDDARPEDLRALVRWLDAPTGLSVERQTRRGNVLYRYDDE